MDLITKGSFVLIIFIIIGFIFLITLLLKILEIIGKWKLFKKAGKQGWEAIIPFYSTWILVSISDCYWWFFLLIFSNSLSLGFIIQNNNTSISYNPIQFIGTFISIFAYYCVNYNISKKLNKDYLYAIGLTFLPFIFYPIIGFSKDKFNKNKKVSPYGVFEEGDLKK